MRLIRTSSILTLALGAYVTLVIILAIPLLGNQDLSGELRIDAIDRNQGRVGPPLQLMITGSGFDRDTRFSLVLDSGNQQAIINRIDSFGAINTLLLDGRTLYLGLGEQRIHQLDISDPEHPEFRKKYPTPGIATSLAKHQEALWAATGEGDLVRLDLVGQPTTSSPSELIAQLATDEAGLLYLATGKQGLRIFRPQPDQVKLEQIGALNLPGQTLNVVVSNNLAFVDNRQTGLHICDLADPSSPKVLATLAHTGVTQDIALRKNLVLLATTEGLSVVDAANPRQPHLLARLSLGNLNKIAIDGDRVLLAAGVSGLLMVDISNPKQPQITGHLTPGDSIRCVAIKDGRAYLGTQSTGLLIADLNRLGEHPDWRPKTMPFPIPVATPENTLQLSEEHLKALLSSVRQQLPADCTPEYLAYNETAAYFCTSCGLATTPLNAPEKLELLRQPLSYTKIIRLSGATAYVVGAKEPISPDAPNETLKNNSVGLQVFDLSNPMKPRAQMFIKTDDLVQQILTTQDRAYLTIQNQGVLIVDTRDPSHPHPLGMAKLPWPEQEFASYNQIYLNRNRLYIANGRAGLQVFDVSDPRHPRRTAAWNTPGGWISRIAGQQNQLFTNNFKNQLQLYDISNRSHPRLTGTLDHFAGVQAIDIHNHKLRITGTADLQIERALPLIPQKVELRGNTLATLTFPSPVFAGNYLLYAFNNQGRQQLPGVIRVEAAQK